jgi:hypothetical protein
VEIMRDRIEDDAKGLAHLDLFADLGGELGGRLEVFAYDWNESKSLGEEFKDLPRLSESGHCGRSSANNARAIERRGQDQAEKGTRSDSSERGRAHVGPGWRLLSHSSSSFSASASTSTPTSRMANELLDPVLSLYPLPRAAHARSNLSDASSIRL